MTADLRLLELFLLATLCLFGLWWQHRTWVRNDRDMVLPRRVRWPLLFGAAVILGHGLLCLLVWLDPRKPANPAEDLWTLARYSIALVFLVVQAYFGALVVCWSLCWGVYGWFEYNVWEPWPLLDRLFEFAFGNPIEVTIWVYKAGAFLAMAGATWLEMWAGSPPHEGVG